VPRRRAAHDKLDRDARLLLGVLADRGRIATRLEEVGARARGFESRDDALRGLDESFEEARREWFATNEMPEEQDTRLFGGLRSPLVVPGGEGVARG
jgi:hypothetical protein